MCAVRCGRRVHLELHVSVEETEEPADGDGREVDVERVEVPGEARHVHVHEVAQDALLRLQPEQVRRQVLFAREVYFSERHEEPAAASARAYCYVMTGNSLECESPQFIFQIVISDRLYRALKAWHMLEWVTFYSYMSILYCRCTGTVEDASAIGGRAHQNASSFSMKSSGTAARKFMPWQ